MGSCKPCLYVKLYFPCFKPVKSGFSFVLSVAKTELLIYSTGITASSIQSLQKPIVSVCMTFPPPPFNGCVDKDPILGQNCYF